MASTIKVFDFDIDMSGARVTIRREPLCSGCLTDGEVDYQIQLLKNDLDAVAKRMKRAIIEQRKQPLFPETPMPTGPKGQKRPADVIGNAVRVMRTAFGEDGRGSA